jgi:hypothetical protein
MRLAYRFPVCIHLRLFTWLHMSIALVKMGIKEVSLITQPAWSNYRSGRTEGLDFVTWYKDTINVFPVVLCFELFFTSPIQFATLKFQIDHNGGEDEDTT